MSIADRDDAKDSLLMPHNRPIRGMRATPGCRRALYGLLLAAVGACGCRSPMGTAALKPLPEESASIADVMGPQERRLRSAEWQNRKDQLKSSGFPLEGLAEFEAAQALYDQGEYRAAERAFTSLARQRSRAQQTWQSRVEELFAREPVSSLDGYGDPIEEDALFMVGETQFARQRYASAQDSYGRLLEKYPSTRHLDQVTGRLFQIARTWLGVPQQAQSEDGIELVSHSEDGRETPKVEVASGPANWPVVPNLFDRTRPVFDTNGRAMQALESIWRHDATGPLADDALMLQATYYQRKGDFVEAARLYALLRETYPDSSHVQDAVILGSHVTLASYSGPEYEGRALQDARQLKQIALQSFSELSEDQRERLNEELELIAQQEAERDWKLVEFYLRKNQPASVALHCNRIINRYPNTPLAARAWEVLRAQEEEFDSPRRWRPRFGIAQAPGAVEDQSDAAAPAVDADPPPGGETEEPKRSWLPRFLRPVESPPDLKPVVPDEVDDQTAEAEAVGRVKL
ncbi:MAG: outer membrane protein assembly factor BamD [Planctomycetota bacterium]|nr:MAG: outer membrane protein assembly factor BamD [Planctomycetota bacterium]